MIPSQNSRIVTPDLKEWMDRRKRELRSELNCVSIGTIKAFDAATQTATIQINFLRLIQSFSAIGSPFLDQAGDYKLEYPLLVNCPVMVLSGGTGRLTFPIGTGDTCLVLFADKDIDTWYSSGQINAPNSGRTHDLNDGIAIVGVRSLLNKLTDYSSQVELKWPDGLITVNDATGERLSQSGDLKATARSTAPSGWLLCYGQSVAAATYPYLFDAIGYTYGGSGDNFNVPDLRGRVPVGLDNMGGSSADVLTNSFTPNRNVLGGAIGEQTHTLTIPEMPAHHHSITNIVPPGAADSGGSVDTHGTTVTGDTGGDQPHYNVQPGRMFNWVIKI